MYSTPEYEQQAASRRMAMAARRSQEPQAIALAIPAPARPVVTPLLLISLLVSLIVLISLVLILLGL